MRGRLHSTIMGWLCHKPFEEFVWLISGLRYGHATTLPGSSHLSPSPSASHATAQLSCVAQPAILTVGTRFETGEGSTAASTHGYLAINRSQQCRAGATDGRWQQSSERETVMLTSLCAPQIFLSAFSRNASCYLVLAKIIYSSLAVAQLPIGLFGISICQLFRGVEEQQDPARETAVHLKIPFGRTA
ncbi:hypothetical protein NPIL_429751 [Nephila pilipes]|uniref:Uncharacterized protein n=1 Tax=Nephila pilipes TaxID=299642 RepID=A0A8X6T433_NEPPI|nr:hypothetical protein NPIL_429751 [Nephila pilipes]